MRLKTILENLTEVVENHQDALRLHNEAFDTQFKILKAHEKRIAELERQLGIE